MASRAGERNLVLTFIRRLAEELEGALGDFAEVKTFHAYCKRLLHEGNRRIALVPFLTKIVQNDSQVLGFGLSDFDARFQVLEEDAEEIKFYLERGDYYEAVSFDDSVYRVLQSVRKDMIELPTFSQILIDEYQDFNPLEVAFIDELEGQGNILIVGDDDQAVYTRRNSSAQHLRDKYASGRYEIFELPFCSRCPSVIVETVTGFIENAQKMRLLLDRIPRPFRPYAEGKEVTDSRYPRIVVARLSTLPTVAKYIRIEIEKIPEEDIAESWSEDDEYASVLIVGPYHYISEIYKSLVPDYPCAKLRTSGDPSYSISDGYEILLRQSDSNLGWRILAEALLSSDQYCEILKRTVNGCRMTELLPGEFISEHNEILGLLGQEECGPEAEQRLKELLESNYDAIAGRFSPGADEDEHPVDRMKPSILLTSFQGCKGLSGGHIFIVGANDGEIPKIDKQDCVAEVECCQFIVALSRTRKCCHILSNKWRRNPQTKTGGWVKEFPQSRFLSMIPSEYLEDLGYMRSSDLK